MHHFCKKTLSNKYKVIPFTEELTDQLNARQETYNHIHGSITFNNGKKLKTTPIFIKKRAYTIE